MQRVNQKKPTVTAMQMLAYMEQYWRDHHYSPSTREIADQFSTSTSFVNYCIDRLVENNLLDRTNSIARSLVPRSISKVIEKAFNE